jgi:hypothetical protein
LHVQNLVEHYKLSSATSAKENVYIFLSYLRLFLSSERYLNETLKWSFPRFITKGGLNIQCILDLKIPTWAMRMVVGMAID